MATINSVFKRLGCSAFKWHLNTIPFGIQPLLDHLNTKLVWYSDPQSTAYSVKTLLRRAWWKTSVKMDVDSVDHKKSSVWSTSTMKSSVWLTLTTRKAQSGRCRPVEKLSVVYVDCRCRPSTSGCAFHHALRKGTARRLGNTALYFYIFELLKLLSFFSLIMN